MNNVLQVFQARQVNVGFGQLEENIPGCLTCLHLRVGLSEQVGSRDSLIY